LFLFFNSFDLFNEFGFFFFFFVARYRFGDASWTSAYGNLLGFPAGRSSTSGGGFYGTVGDRFFGSNYSVNRANYNFRTGNSTLGDQQSAWRTHEVIKDGLNLQSLHKHESLHAQPRLTPTDHDHHLNPVTRLQAEVDQERNVGPDLNKTSNVQEWKTFKRKALDCEQLDLDLSLRLTSRNHEVVDSNLSLSMYSQSSSSLTSLKEGPDDIAKKQEKRTSTLDLTI